VNDWIDWSEKEMKKSLVADVDSDHEKFQMSFIYVTCRREYYSILFISIRLFFFVWYAAVLVKNKN